MSGPWEDFKPAKTAAADGPWNDFTPPKPTGPSIGDRVGSAAKSVGSGVKEFFTGGQGLAEQVPIIGPLGRMAGEGFRAVVEGGVKSDETIPQAWDRIRGENKAGDARFAEQNPGADTAQKLVGGIAGAIAIPVPGAKIAGLPGALARVAGTTGIVSGDTALRTGDMDRVKQAATLSGGLQTAVEAIPYAGRTLGPLARTAQAGLSKLAGKADEIAAVRAVKAAFGNRDSAWKAIEGRVQETGKKVLDEGVVSFGDDAAGIAGKAAAGSKEHWAKVDNVFKAADDAGVMIDAKTVADEILVAAQKIEPIGTGRNVAESLIKEATDIQKIGTISLAKAQELKNRFIHKVVDSRTHALGLDGNNIINRAFGNAIKDTVKKSGLPGADDFVNSYQTAGMLGSFGKSAKNTARQLSKNRGPFSLTDYISGGAAGTAAAVLSGDPKDAGLAGIAMAFANGLARKRGNAALATSMRGLGTVLRTTPEALGKSYQVLEKAARTSPAAFAAAHEIMLQNDPAYRKAVTPEDQPKGGKPTGMPIAPENAIDRRLKRMGE